jgi:hypothetical protein
MNKYDVLTKFLAGLLFISIHSAVNATTYTQDTILSDFTSGVSEYATFVSAGTFWINDIAMGTAPTSADILAGKRVVGDGNVNPIVVSFSNAVSNIRVFANMDHLGAAYDGYQYSIFGSNDNKSYTALFDALGVNGIGEPFTLGAFSGTAPTSVNNIVTGNSFSGATGYIADFSFNNSYKFYKFGVSSFAASEGNADQELSAVAAVPEPETYATMMVGLGVMGAVARRRKGKQIRE